MCIRDSVKWEQIPRQKQTNFSFICQKSQTNHEIQTKCVIFYVIQTKWNAKKQLTWFPLPNSNEEMFDRRKEPSCSRVTHRKKSVIKITQKKLKWKSWVIRFSRAIFPFVCRYWNGSDFKPNCNCKSCASAEIVWMNKKREITQNIHIYLNVVAIVVLPCLWTKEDGLFMLFSVRLECTRDKRRCIRVLCF